MNRPRAADDFATIRARIEELRYRPRAADDFAAIRAQMEKLRRDVNRPRAADDFTTIRARMEELRRGREGAQAPEDDLPCDPPVPRAPTDR